MRHFRRIGFSVILVTALFATACGGESITGPSAAEYSGVVTVRGTVTSGIDGAPLTDATVYVGHWVSSTCHGIGCGDSWKVVAKATTDDSGAYELSFLAQRCTGRNSISLRAVAAGHSLYLLHFLFPEAEYHLATSDVRCQASPQGIDFTLEPIVPW